MKSPTRPITTAELRELLQHATDANSQLASAFDRLGEAPDIYSIRRQAFITKMREELFPSEASNPLF